MPHLTEAEARQAHVQLAAYQKFALQFAEETLEVQKQAAADQKLLAENEYLKAQIMSNINYINCHYPKDHYEVVTIKAKGGWVVGVVNKTSGQLLQRSRGPKEYSINHINASLHGLHKHYAEEVATIIRNKGHQLSD